MNSNASIDALELVLTRIYARATNRFVIRLLRGASLNFKPWSVV